MKPEPLDWSQQRVFVTGASGFVGSWLVKALLEKKAAVTVLIRDLDDHSELVRSGWSIKHLHRLILLSSTYQTSSAHDGPDAGRNMSLATSSLPLLGLRNPWALGADRFGRLMRGGSASGLC